jgi:NADH dehydrogenase/NADH:ubiquinone oxidoreductase subunit G
VKILCQRRNAGIPKPINKEVIMNTTKSRTPASNGAADADAANENRYRRTNPEAEAKINDWIKTNSRNWEYIQAMPRDRLERTVVLNEVRQLERRQYVDTGVLQNIKNNPEMKAAYDVLLKDVPEDQRDEAIVSMEREKWLNKKIQSQTQSQTRREGVRI